PRSLHICTNETRLLDAAGWKGDLDTKEEIRRLCLFSKSDGFIQANDADTHRYRMSLTSLCALSTMQSERRQSITPSERTIMTAILPTTPLFCPYPVKKVKNV